MRLFAFLIFIPNIAFANVTFHVYAKPGVHVNGKCPSTAILSHDKKKLIATVDLSKCNTGNGARDTHMKEDLNVAKHPVARLEANLQADSFEGKLSINGVTKTVSGKRAGGSLSFATKLSEFDVPRRSKVLGLVSVQDDVEIVGEF